MEIILNGQPTTCPEPATVQQLLDRLGIPLPGTAVACNDTVIRKAAYAATPLAPGDRVEIIRAVAGG